MGKDSENKGSENSSQSRDDIKAEHTRLVNEEKNLSVEYGEIKEIFHKLEETYGASKGSFSVQRYGQLKDMIKDTTCEATINKLKQTIQASKGDRGRGKSGMSALLNKAKEFSGDSQQAQDQLQDEAKASKPSGKMSGFMKKLKNFTGFTDEPVTDEDVMSSSQIQRDNGRKQRSIQHIQTQLAKALTKLEKLQHDYQASKSLSPPKRYQELKNMIKEATAEKLA